MSTTASIDGAEVFSLADRAIEPVTLRNSSSADCPDSGFAVVVLQNDNHWPEPRIQWRVDGGAWHGAGLTWDDGSNSGDAGCASPCWTTGVARVDVPAHSALTIDIAMLFPAVPGATSEGFMGVVDYTDDTAVQESASGPILSWSYYNRAGSGSGGNAPGGGRTSAAAGSRPPAPTHSTAPSRKASPSLSADASLSASPTSTDTSTSASPAASSTSANLATVADVHSGGSGMSSVLAWIGVVVLVMAAGGGFVVARRRRARRASDVT